MGRRALLWLVPLFITLHNLEEMAGMGVLLRNARLAGIVPAPLAGLLPAGVFPPTYRQFLVMLLIVTLLPYVLILLGRGRERGPATLLLAAAQMLMLVNVGSHLVTALVTEGYVPGLVTALVFNLPFSLVFFASGLRGRWLRAQDFVYLVAAALILHGPGLLGLMVLAGRLAAL